MMPSPHDVLFGRGSAANDHPGNRMFRKWIEESLQSYGEAPKKEKGYICARIVNLVQCQNPRGRFLKPWNEFNPDGGWEEVLDPHVLLAKTGQAFRDARKVKYNSVSPPPHVGTPTNSQQNYTPHHHPNTIPPISFGTTFWKKFPDYGWFQGRVIQFIRETGLYRIQYTDGDTEDLDRYQISQLMGNNPPTQLMGNNPPMRMPIPPHSQSNNAIGNGGKEGPTGQLMVNNPLRPQGQRTNASCPIEAELAVSLSSLLAEEIMNGGIEGQQQQRGKDNTITSNGQDSTSEASPVVAAGAPPDPVVPENQGSYSPKKLQPPPPDQQQQQHQVSLDNNSSKTTGSSGLSSPKKETPPEVVSLLDSDDESDQIDAEDAAPAAPTAEANVAPTTSNHNSTDGTKDGSNSATATSDNERPPKRQRLEDPTKQEIEGTSPQKERPPPIQEQTAASGSYSHLLFSHEKSDVVITCQDVPPKPSSYPSSPTKDDIIELLAHKVVLEKSSPVLRAFWIADPFCKSLFFPYPAPVVRQVLTHIYDPQQSIHIAADILDSYLPQFLEFTKTFGWKDLHGHVFQKAYDTLNMDNLLWTLMDKPSMTGVCRTFVRNHAVEVLTRPQFTRLSTENPDTWKTIVEAAVQTKGDCLPGTK